MLTHEEMIGLQAEKHDLITEKEFRTKEQYVLHLIHTAAYIHALPFVKDKIVLDLGCNTGYGTDILAEVAQKVTGVDVSSGAIRAAKQRYANRGIEFFETDGNALPFDDDLYDVVVSFQVIEHIVDYTAYLGELKRVLKDDGIVIFTTPNSLIRLDPNMKPWNEFHVREFSAVELEEFLGEHFVQTEVYGLQAEKPLADIERTRVAYARKWARGEIQQVRPSFLKRAFTRMIPQRIYDIYTKKGEVLEKQARELAEIKSRYTVGDFAYTKEGLEDCLDLLAVCGSDKAPPSQSSQQV